MANYGHLSAGHKSPKCCGFSATFVHYFLFIFNFIFLMSGILILLLTLLYGTPYLELGDTRLHSIRRVISAMHLVNLIHYAMVSCGAAICLISVINTLANCCRSDKPQDQHQMRELNQTEVPLTSTRIASTSKAHHHQRYDSQPTRASSLPLCFFIFALLFLFTLQLIIGLIAFVAITPNADGQDEFGPSLTENLDLNEVLLSKQDQLAGLQQYFKCCGWRSFDDYESTNRSNPVPDSCCKTVIDNCGHRKHPSNIYYDGCVEKFAPVLKEYVIVLGSVAFGFSIIEIFGLVFSCCFYVQLANRR